MRYRRLGRTGFEVSEIGHGLWGMGGWTGGDDAEALGVLQKSVSLGCNFFDTAWAYGDGKSDEILGELLRRNRDRKLFVAAKIPPKNLVWPGSWQDRYNDVFPESHVLEYTDRIRKTLGVDRIDLLQFHVWDDSWSDSDDFPQVVKRLKSEGLITAFGLSLNRWEPMNGARALRSGCVDSVQVIYNIFDQAPEDELLPLCTELDIGVIARVPLDEGSLGGTLTRDTTFPVDDWRSRYFGPENLGPTVDRVDTLKPLVPAGMKLSELALRFILSNPAISTTIVGMRTYDHVLENITASDKGGLERVLLKKLNTHRWDREVTPWAN